MKKIIQVTLFLLLVLSTFFAFRKSPNPNYYYAFSKKKFFTEHQSKLVVRFRTASTRAAFQARVAIMDTSHSQQWFDKRTVFFTASSENNQQALLQKFANDSDVASVHPVEIIDEAMEAGITDEFVAQFNDNVSKATIDSLNKRYGVTIVATSFFYTLQVKPRADALQIANAYQETGLVKFSHPNFMSTPNLHHIPNDPYFNFQWNFYNTGQVINDGHTGTAGADIKATTAWDITTGSNAITIAILDAGVTSDHPDLPNTRQVRLNGSNFGDGNVNDPSPLGTGGLNAHGDCTAGLAAATMDNNQGITGLCPNCRIMPIRIFNSDGSGIAVGSVANAITFAYTNGADILSNSWGYSSSDPNDIPVIVTAIQNAVTLGRSGQGSLVVFSAGNFSAQPGYVSFPACVGIANVLAVGASDRNDQQAAYSPTGVFSTGHTVVDLVAPSHRAYPEQIAGETFEIWSMDMPGLNVGYNSWPSDQSEHPPVVGETLPNAGTNFDAYTGRFGGTSASCPQVAGLAGLVLSVNPGMNVTSLATLLIYNADKVGGYDYSNGGRSTQMGYGRINACATVVNSIPITGPASFCTSATYTLPNLPAGAAVTWSFSSGTGSVSLAPNGNSVTLTKITDGDIYFGAAISNTCKAGTFAVGAHVVAGTPQPHLSEQPENSGDCFYDVVATVPTGSTAIQFSTNGSAWSNAAIRTTPGIGPQAFIETGVQGPMTVSYDLRSVNACGTGSSSAKQSVTIPKPKSSCPQIVTSGFAVSLYPNPSAGLVTVSSPATPVATSKIGQLQDQVKAPVAIRLINVYTIDGKLLRHFEYSTPITQATIDLSRLPSGNYVIEVGDRNSRSTQNLMLKH